MIGPLTLSDYLWSIFDYNFFSGQLIVKGLPEGEYSVQHIAKHKKKVGSPAGRIGCDGYVTVYLPWRQDKAHRLIWCMCHGQMPDPAKEIDHKNRQRADNHIDNLREATRGQNNKNKLRDKNNSGKTGVWQYRPKHWDGIAWVAQISENGKTRHIGTFKTKEQAIEARETEEKRLQYYEF